MTVTVVAVTSVRTAMGRSTAAADAADCGLADTDAARAPSRAASSTASSFRIATLTSVRSAQHSAAEWVQFTQTAVHSHHDGRSRADRH